MEEALEMGGLGVSPKRKQVGGRTPARARRPSHLLLAATLAVLPAILGAETLAERLARVVDEHPASKRANVGVYVVDAKTGEPIFARNEDRLFTPASNVKLYTSAFALATWGKDKTFETKLTSEGSLRDGTFEGIVELSGMGDPVLADDDLKALANEFVVANGLKTIRGFVRANADYPGERATMSEAPWGPGWAWDDFADPYSMEVTRIMLNYNTVAVSVAGTPEEPTLAVHPEHEWSTAGMIAKSVQSWSASRMKLGGAIMVFRPSDAKASLPSSDFRFAAWKSTHHMRLVLKRLLENAGAECIEDSEIFENDSTKAADRRTARSATHASPPLSEILSRFMKPSENAIGEMLFLNLAEHLGGAWDWPDAEKAERAWLEQTVGLAPDEFRLVDGSGLSRYNLITAAGTVKLLRFMYAHPDFNVFEASLPIAGVDGTLANRMKGTSAANVVHAKTGTMSGISCLSGYAPAADGRTLAFSILVNGYVGSSAPARDLQDKLCVALVTPADPAPRVAFDVE